MFVGVMMTVITNDAEQQEGIERTAPPRLAAGVKGLMVFFSAMEFPTWLAFWLCFWAMQLSVKGCLDKRKEVIDDQLRFCTSIACVLLFVVWSVWACCITFFEFYGIREVFRETQIGVALRFEFIKCFCCCFVFVC